ncbi:hypothetical protein [Flavilitoribacter nigricans]|uniref:DUF4403 family protein n=1 Tax=Flavilitoribacter nigricans (strain ATCC 23147 / DSM 23189 / NBRC 102662 / NCIMB 1420 / SS-2) TaxID=1122177 RepID=A0A2D0NA13_FLAN2|nr:hypothetical protein [Flavilitoribacter nigricans]PHN05327.1 hypothetical protein CRP01_17580 [Flavilitoribacter nigricans DSM 23189 = NBRC 102662]
MNFVKIFPQYLLTCMVLFLFSSVNAQIATVGGYAPNPGAPKVAKVYAGNDGGAYYCTESGNKVYCFAEHPGRNYSYVIEGTRSGNVINAKFWGVPKEGATKTGTIKLQILPNASMKLIYQSGGFPSSTFSIKTISQIKNLLPRPSKTPAFSTLKLSDLDGGFKDANGYYYYFRQVGTKVVMFCERDFQKGQQPAGAFVFIGSRQGNGVQGTVVSVPKGIKQGKGNFGVQVMSNGSLKKFSAINFGSDLLSMILDIKDIPIPINHAVDVLDSQLKYTKIKLDGYDEGGKALTDGSYVQLKGMPAFKFSLPYLQVTTGSSRFPRLQTHRRSFINDMSSDIIQLKSLGGNKMRLTVIFENGGREIKRYCRQCAGKPGDGGPQDNIMQDWDLQNPRVDIEIELINKKTSGGKNSISFKTTNVKLHAWIDAPALWDKIEQWIMNKVRPEAEQRIMNYLNDPKLQTMVADKMYQGLLSASAYVNQYELLGYNLLNIQPKGIVVSNGKVVFQFK